MTRRRPGRGPDPTSLRYQLSLEALGLMRHKRWSLTRAAAEVGVSRDSVLRHVGHALRRTARGTYVARPTDRLPRPMRVPTWNGPVSVVVRDSRAASVLGSYWAATDLAARGDRTALRPFKGVVIRSGRRRFPLLTDHRRVAQLASVGEVAFESVYDYTL
jgi:hypothetical protein